jgi:integrase
MGQDNYRNRVVKGAVRRANAALEANGHPPLPEKLTPRSLRVTFCTVLYALGETPPVVMAEMGHTDPTLALKVYARVMRLDDSERAKLAALIEGDVLANTGQSATDEALTPRPPEAD